jgi:hypothetical protein
LVGVSVLNVVFHLLSPGDEVQSQSTPFKYALHALAHCCNDFFHVGDETSLCMSVKAVEAQGMLDYIFAAQTYTTVRWL